ncbi:MAG: protein kinase domain-containing protein, partial [Planctomycetota bacterium]
MTTPIAVRVSLTGALSGGYVVSRDQPLTLGRAGRARILDLASSRLHCRIELTGHGLELTDLSSTNGTYLNENRISRHPLTDGDRVRIGNSLIEVRLEPHRSQPGEADGEMQLCCECGTALTARAIAEGGGVPREGRVICVTCHARRVAGWRGDGAISGRLASDGFRDVARLRLGERDVYFNARRAPLDQPVTVKVLDTRGKPKTQIDCFLREARTVARLSHAGLMRVLDVQTTGDLVYVVLDRLEGRTLAAELEDRAPMDAARAITFALPLARALAYLQSHALCHRDIRPQNVVVDANGQIRLIGFSLSTPIAPRGDLPHQSEVPEFHASFTFRGGPMSSLSYSAPELLTDPQRSAAGIDIYGFGACLYHALAGFAPFSDCENPLVGPSEPTPLATIRPELEPALCYLAHRCLRRSPEERYKDATELVEAVEDAVRAVYGLPARGLMPSVVTTLGTSDLLDDTARRSLRRDLGTLERECAGFFGRFTGSELLELTQLIEMNKKTGVVEVRTQCGISGEMAFREGRAVRVRLGEA